MLTLCPSCFEIYSDNSSKTSCTCTDKAVNVSVDLLDVVNMLINRGFKVLNASCNTFKDKDGSGKVTQIDIPFKEKYPEYIFAELPPDWSIYEFNIVKDNQVLKTKYTGLSCVCEHPPNECDAESVAFDKKVTISNLEVWLEEKDPESFRALLILAGCL